MMSEEIVGIEWVGEQVTYSDWGVLHVGFLVGSGGLNAVSSMQRVSSSRAKCHTSYGFCHSPSHECHFYHPEIADIIFFSATCSCLGKQRLSC